MNLTISKRDAKLLLILLGIVILLVAYLAVYNPYISKTDAVRAEADALRPQLSELQGYYANLDAYNAGIDECADTMSTQLERYPTDVRSEDLLMYAVQLQQSTGIAVQGISFTGPEVLSQFSEISKADDGTYTTRDAAAMRSGATLTMSLSYQSLKDLLDTLSGEAHRTALDNVGVTYDSETGALTGDATFYRYFITGDGDEYVRTTVPSVPLGTEDLFGTVPGADGTDTGGDVTIIG